MIEMLNCDCMDYMRSLPDKAFELAIVDPPYGIGDRWLRPGENCKSAAAMDGDRWDYSPPTAEYFSELFRVSKNQIIWGGNYFILPATRGIICWDKQQTYPNFSQWEMAWTSFDCVARIFKCTSTNLSRIHPTQKPVALYKWLLSRYAKPGDRILDTHGGSGSIAIACHDLGYDLTWIELDTDYYKAACERYQRHAAQGSLFEPKEVRSKPVEHELF